MLTNNLLRLSLGLEIVCVCACSLVSDSLFSHWLQQPGSSVHGISQARILECIAICYSRGSSWPRNQTCVSHVSYIGRWILYSLSHLGNPVRIMLSLPFFSIISIFLCYSYSSKTWLFNALATLCCNVSCDRNSVLVTEKLVVLL